MPTAVPQSSSPAFICHTSTDTTVPVHNALCLAQAYANAKMPFELHIFKQAPHGMALGNEITMCGNLEWKNDAAAKWTDLAKIWMNNLK
jgi:acetyl esterase/lipase